tara:strand:- start:187 stop:435 length:249 start_codon:yes stop_codon:yes gene_type:complete
MKIEEVNLTTWFSERNVHTHCPEHFIVTRTRLTPETLNWVTEKTHGRYSIVKNSSVPTAYNAFNVIAFEDKKDAVLYELIWS